MIARNAEARRKDWDPEPEADDTAGAVPRAGTAWRLATRLASPRGLLALGSLAGDSAPALRLQARDRPIW